ncbi:hypothetical protein [Candidatus Tisiphia endosymbiont of Dascillus cervinus]
MQDEPYKDQYFNFNV